MSISIYGCSVFPPISELPVGIFFERNEFLTEEEAGAADICVRALQLSPDNVDDTYTVTVTSEDSTATGIFSV